MDLKSKLPTELLREGRGGAGPLSSKRLLKKYFFYPFPNNIVKLEVALIIRTDLVQELLWKGKWQKERLSLYWMPKAPLRAESSILGLETSEYPRHSTGKQLEERTSLEPIANKKQ